MAFNPDYPLLAARTLTPGRADVAPARKLARGKTEAADAWVALAPLLGPLEAGSAMRAFAQSPFVLPGAKEEPQAPNVGENVGPVPPTPKACRAMATHAEAVAAAEELARETVRRLAPFGVSMRERILWSIVPAFPGAGQGGDFLFDAVYKALLPADLEKATNISLRAGYRSGADSYGAELGIRCSTAVDQKLCEPYVDAVGFAAVWERAVLAKIAAPSYSHAPGETIPAAGVAFADLPNPFEPLLDLMLKGYWLSGATADSLILVATEPERRGRR